MFPKYQKIQKSRLRKMMMGPESTKKSQKLSWAKMPSRNRTRPATSSTMARTKKPKQRPTRLVKSIALELRSQRVLESRQQLRYAAFLRLLNESDWSKVSSPCLCDDTDATLTYTHTHTHGRDL